MKKQKTQSKIIVALTAVVILLVAVSATLTFAYFTANASETSSQMTFGTLNLGGNGLTLSDGDTAPKHATTSNNTISPVVPGCTFNLAGSITVTTNIDTLVRTKMIVTVKQYRDENGVPFTMEGAVQGTAEGKTTKYYLAGHVNDDDYEIKGQANAYYLETTTSLAATANGNKAQIIFNKINAVIGTAIGSTLGNWVNCADDGYRYFDKVVNGLDVANNAVTILDFGDASRITLEADQFGNDWQGAVISVSFQTEAIQAQHLTDIPADANDTPENIAITMSAASSGVKAITSVKVGDAAAVNATTTDPNDNIASVIAKIATASAWAVDLDTGLQPVTP